MKAGFEGYLEFKAHQSIKYLYKDFIVILEDLLESGELDEETFFILRKKVLDKGNDSIRNLSKELEIFSETYHNE